MTKKNDRNKTNCMPQKHLLHGHLKPRKAITAQEHKKLHPFEIQTKGQKWWKAWIPLWMDAHFDGPENAHLGIYSPLHLFG